MNSIDGINRHQDSCDEKEREREREKNHLLIFDDGLNFFCLLAAHLLFHLEKIREK